MLGTTSYMGQYGLGSWELKEVSVSPDCGFGRRLCHGGVWPAREDRHRGPCQGRWAEFTPATSRRSALLHHGEEVPLPLPSFRVQNRTFLGQVAEVRVITRGPVKRRFPGLRFL